MNIVTKDADGIKVVMFAGELDTNAAPELEKEFNQLLDQGVNKILVNCEKMDFISSSGLRVLLATAQKLKDSNGELRVCCLNEDVQEVFDISGFSTILMVFKDESEALQGF
jgi:anti-sigma B factor antagonist